MFAVTSLQADTIYLKNGQTVTGDIVGQTRTRIDVQTTAGLKRVQKTNIRRVVFSKNNGADDAAARKAREEAARKAAQEAAARKAREEAARKSAQEAAARKAREEAARKSAQEAAARKAREEAARKSAQEAAARKAAQEAEAARKNQVEDSRPSSVTRGGALWRSLILPGWGQYAQGRNIAAFGYGGAFVGAAALTASYEADYRSKQSALDSAGSNLNFSIVVLGASLPFIDPSLTLRPQLFNLQLYQFSERNAARSAAQSASRNVQLGSMLLGAVYLANIVDVILFHPTASSNVGLYTGAGAAGLRFQMRF
ncbi:MAG: DUF5683 domain-containing protein [bacterium]|nr:DUF5683 domain-containing protein [bacterium]